MNKGFSNRINSFSNITYKEIGNGEPVIFLGGFFFPSEAYDLDEIEGYKLITPFISGAPYRDERPVSFDDHVELLKVFCDAKEIKPDYLIGHSLGGSIALEYASRYGAKKVYAANPALAVNHSMPLHCVRYISETLFDLKYVVQPQEQKQEKKQKAKETNYSLFVELLKRPLCSFKQIKGINDLCYTGSDTLNGIIAHGLDDLVYTKKDYTYFFKNNNFPKIEYKRISSQGHNWFLYDKKFVADEIKKFLD